MKKMMVLCMIFITILTATPMITQAQSRISCDVGEIQQDELEVTLISSRTGVEQDGVCHCGARREKVEQIRVRTGGCTETNHDVGKCLFYDHRYYYYCTNPYCNDNWYSAWENYKTEHNVL